jgi:hypothetical protein
VREIGFAAAVGPGAAEGAVALAGEGEDEDALVPVDVGAVEDGVAAGVTPVACLEPKIADTMLPKTLIFSSFARVASRAQTDPISRAF